VVREPSLLLSFIADESKLALSFNHPNQYIIMKPPSEIVKCGMVALIGPPNAGKSTLLNNLLGQKISIVSPKPQTTRNRIVGIANGPDYQIIFLDTPGLHHARDIFNREMVRIALETISEVDATCFIIDATFPPPEKERNPVRFIESSSTQTILLLNKVDLVNKQKLLPLIEAYQTYYPFKTIIPLSALNGDGIDRLLQELLPLLPTGPRLYPEDIPTDATERFIVAEIIREKVFLQTSQEIPYSTAVVIDSFSEDTSNKLVTIHATIIVEKNSQKGIIIGKSGSMLRQIGAAARHDIEALLDSRVLLKLWVKVQKNWTRNERFLRELGF